MTKEMKSPTWNLADFYSGIEDEKITQDLKNIAKNVKNFVAKYHGKTAKLKAEELLLAIKNYEKSLELDPNNENARKALKEIKKAK